MLFEDEVKDMNELVPKLQGLSNLGKVKVAVVCFLFDKDDKLVLHRRGPGARDEIGKLEAIGGSINKSDADFRTSLLRELNEEAGTQAKYELGDFLGAFVDGKVDNTTREFVNWIVLGYKGKILSGTLTNMEPDRCVGFESFNLNEINPSELPKSTNTFVNKLKGE